jgi:chlorite dismutase
MYKLVLSLLFLVFLACNEESKPYKTELESMDQQILQVHDEVMPKIGKVLSLRKKVNGLLDSTSDSFTKDTLQKMSYQLTRADADMMSWMRTYKKPEVSDTAMVYLAQQFAEILLVKDEINSSIEKAESYLARHNQIQK